MKRDEGRLMPKTVRKFWGPLKGRATLNFNWPTINRDSVVLVMRG